jgi:CheY-like chemotaxis protein
VGYAELMAEQAAVWNDRELEGYCATVRTCALESAQIIRQLLELSKPSAPALARLDLREPIEEAMTFTQLRVKESDTTFTLDLPGTAVMVLADATQVKQLIVNLVLNAIDAMADSDVRRLSVCLAASHEIATLTVHDSGCGIPAHSIDRIFDPFFTTKRPDEGTGLGLSVCSAIVRQHNGVISVESTAERGSTFTVTLPLRVESAHSAASAPAVRTSGARTTEYRGLPALVVDDEVAAGQVVKRALERMMGLDVSWVPDGEMAVERLGEHDYALVVSDMRMPKMDGLDLLAWIRKHRPAMVSRILFITGDAGVDRDDAVRRAGARLLLKPFRIDALVRECRSIIAGPDGLAYPISPST